MSRQRAIIIALAALVWGCAQGPNVDPHPDPVDVATCRVHGELMTEELARVVPAFLPDDEGLAQAEFFPNDGVIHRADLSPGQDYEISTDVCRECQRARTAWERSRRAR